MLSKIDHSADLLNFELFFELSPDLLCIARYDGYFQRVNSSVCKLLGYSYDELYSRPIYEFIHPEDKEITARHRSHLIKNNSLVNFENRYLSKAGETVWLSWTSVSVDGEELVYAIAKNITDRKKLESDRNDLLANLSKVNYDLRMLNYKTSHDLRSPVNNLLSLFSLMDISRIRDEETIEYIEMLKSATTNLKETLNDYVDILNEKQTLSNSVEEVCFQECLDNVLFSIKGLIQSAGAVLYVDFSSVPRIKFNKTYLESIFLNFITNSIKYALPDSPPVISVYSTNKDGVDQLIFIDNGQGFDMEKVKDKVFGFNEHFHNDKDSKGIGLYLVHNHITSLGGKIALESKVNEGAKFTISFRSSVVRQSKDLPDNLLEPRL